MANHFLNLCLAIVSLCLICLCIFVLFRHIEIRKIQSENLGAAREGKYASKTLTKQDGAIMVLRVLAVLVFLLMFMDEDKGTRWITMIISYVLIVFLSLLFLAKGGALPEALLERKWEYLALFSILVFGAGACISLIAFSALMTKYGNSYFGPARIVGWNDDGEEMDDDGAGKDEGEDKDEHEEEGEENDKDDENERDDEEDNREDEDRNDEQQGEENEGNEGGEDGAGRMLEDARGEEEEEDNDHENEDRDEEDDREEENDREEQNGGNRNDEKDEGQQAKQYSYIRVQWGGQWGCPDTPSTYCKAEIQTACDLWDIDEISGFHEPVNWKFWDGKNDQRLDGVFSCAYGFEQELDEENGYNVDTSPVNSGDSYPYAYIVGNCNTCEAQWAWVTYHKRYLEIQGYHALFQNYMLLSAVALLSWLGLSMRRKWVASRDRGQADAKVELLENDQGVSA